MPTDRLAGSVGVLVMLNVITVYGYSLGMKGVYPTSHPWSGIALTLLSVSLIWKSRKAGMSRLALVLIALAAALWTVAVILDAG